MYKMEYNIYRPIEVEKAWGKEIWMANTGLYCGKKLMLNKGKRCSLHYHKLKDETFYLDSGRIFLEIGGKEIIMNPGESIIVHPTINHRFSGLEDSVIIEISTHHEDSDSYRVPGESSGDIPEEVLKRINKLNNFLLDFKKD